MSTPRYSPGDAVAFRHPAAADAGWQFGTVADTEDDGSSPTVAVAYLSWDLDKNEPVRCLASVPRFMLRPANPADDPTTRNAALQTVLHLIGQAHDRLSRLET